jgi:hypothetical protein
MTDPTKRTVEDIAAELEISEAEADAGDVVSGEVVLAKLRASMARLKAKQKAEQHRTALRNR